MRLKVNGEVREANVADDMPLLWVLRDHLGLTGTKFGCGVAQCGACKVHLNGQPIPSCVTPVSTVVDGEVLTIEGLSAKADHPVQMAWIQLDVPQCGYCQSGQIMAAAALLSRIEKPTDDDINDAMSGNICRCGTYQSIRAAIHRASEIIRQS